jgi:diguanylate cyclase (GGDEF)-like protein
MFGAEIMDYPQSKPRLSVIIVGVVLITVIWVLDYFTTYEVSFSIFYLLPIAYVTWYYNRLAGLVFAALGAVAWMYADILSGHVYSNNFFLYWNAAVRLGFFLIVTITLSKLKAAYGEEQMMARTDSLTGLLNMRSFEALAEQEIERSRRNFKPLTVVYIDCDNFKSVNDNFGHNTGSALLQEIAGLLKASIRPTDLVARFGGDEFVILLTEADHEIASRVISRLRDKLAEAFQARKYTITFSMGSSTFSHPPSSVEEMIKHSDDLMYDVKKHGKDNIKEEVVS